MSNYDILGSADDISQSGINAVNRGALQQLDLTDPNQMNKAASALVGLGQGAQLQNLSDYVLSGMKRKEFNTPLPVYQPKDAQQNAEAQAQAVSSDQGSQTSAPQGQITTSNLPPVPGAQTDAQPANPDALAWHANIIADAKAIQHAGAAGTPERDAAMKATQQKYEQNHQIGPDQFNQVLPDDSDASLNAVISDHVGHVQDAHAGTGVYAPPPPDPDEVPNASTGMSNNAARFYSSPEFEQAVDRKKALTGVDYSNIIDRAKDTLAPLQKTAETAATDKATYLNSPQDVQVAQDIYFNGRQYKKGETAHFDTGQQLVDTRKVLGSDVFGTPSAPDIAGMSAASTAANTPVEGKIVDSNGKILAPQQRYNNPDEANGKAARLGGSFTTSTSPVSMVDTHDPVTGKPNGQAPMTSDQLNNSALGGSTGSQSANTSGQSSEQSVAERNNNPGNLKPLAKGKWAGQTGVDSQGFAIFGNKADGEAAADHNLQAYGSQHGIDNVSDAINRWASSSPLAERQNYIQTVSQALGVQPGDKINLSDPKVRSTMLNAMYGVESGTGGTSQPSSGYAQAPSGRVAGAASPQQSADAMADTTDYTNLRSHYGSNDTLKTITNNVNNDYITMGLADQYAKGPSTQGLSKLVQTFAPFFPGLQPTAQGLDQLNKNLTNQNTNIIQNGPAPRNENEFNQYSSIGSKLTDPKQGIVYNTAMKAANDELEAKYAKFVNSYTNNAANPPSKIAINAAWANTPDGKYGAWIQPAMSRAQIGGQPVVREATIRGQKFYVIGGGLGQKNAEYVKAD